MTKIYILHGWSQDQNNKLKWQPFINELKQNRIDSEFLKIPGLDSKIEKPWNLENYIDWLKSELPKNEKIILLGHSFGGQVSALYASQNNDKVTKLILLDSAGLKDISFKNKFKKTLFFVLAKIGKLISQNPKLKESLYKLAHVHDYEKADNNLRQTLVNVVNQDIGEDIKKVKCSTHIIWGENDKVTPISFANSFNQSIKNSKLHFIKEARHSPQFTHPKKVTNLISDFLSK